MRVSKGECQCVRVGEWVRVCVREGRVKAFDGEEAMRAWSSMYAP